MAKIKLLKTLEYKIPLIRLITDKLIDNKYKNEYRKSHERFRKMKNIHKGERCFLIGSGPSLRYMDLSILKDEICFGANSLISQDNIKCKYYGNASTKPKWIKQSSKKTHSITFLFRNAARLCFDLNMSHKHTLLALKTQGLILRARRFPPDISKQVYGGGGTIMIPCLQVCFFLGFKEVYLLGCDCTYDGESVHFDSQPSVFSGSDSKEMKHWNQVFDAYGICKKEFEKDGRHIYNSTIGGNLNVFKRKKLEDVMNESN